MTTATATTTNPTNPNPTTKIGNLTRPSEGNFTKKFARSAIRGKVKELFGLTLGQFSREGKLYRAIVKKDGEAIFLVSCEHVDGAPIVAHAAREQLVELFKAAKVVTPKAEVKTPVAEKVAKAKVAKVAKAKAKSTATSDAALVALGLTPAQIVAIRAMATAGIAPTSEPAKVAPVAKVAKAKVVKAKVASQTVAEYETGLKRNRRLRAEVKALGLTVANRKTATLVAALAAAEAKAVKVTMVKAPVAELDEDTSRPDMSHLAPKAKAEKVTMDSAMAEVSGFDFGAMGF